MKIIRPDAASEKRAIVRRVLEALPEWFGIEDTREQYIADSGEQMIFAAVIDDEPAGFISLKRTGNATAEIAVMGILKEYHRRGIGRSLFVAAKEAARDEGCEFLQVKTVQMGRYPEYDATNRFYISLGFREFELIPELWDEANPCQIYVMTV